MKYIDYDKLINELKCPVILIASTSETTDKYGAVILIDANNKILTISGKYTQGAAIQNTFQVGDTIVPCS